MVSLGDWDFLATQNITPGEDGVFSQTVIFLDVLFSQLFYIRIRVLFCSSSILVTCGLLRSYFRSLECEDTNGRPWGSRNRPGGSMLDGPTCRR